ncbi:uncharacterized protein [Lolium perenne]|uniref:uncharacterized protein n=1 Tax=Lolium perenne TaxID=4522 RepID=UPI0021F5F0ED|nr:uncharacterized protein LOC127303542 [Lolium perenne]
MEQLARTLSLPRSQVYYLTAEEMHFKITVTLRASTVERWICAVKMDFLDAAPIKCVGLDCEFTNPREGRYNQRAAVLQLSVATENLDKTIRFCGVAIDKDMKMLRSCRIDILSAFNLQKIIPNPTKISF